MAVEICVAFKLFFFFCFLCVIRDEEAFCELRKERKEGKKKRFVGTEHKIEVGCPEIRLIFPIKCEVNQ